MDPKSLIHRARNGDLSAIRELYLQHHNHIYRFIWSRVHNPVVAEDLTGEVFLRMVGNLPKYQERAFPFRAWLYRIARNLIIDDYRQNKNRASVPLEKVTDIVDRGKSLEENTELVLTFDKVRQLLQDLTPDQREVVELRFLASLPLKEVALIIDKSVAAVKSLQHRGLSTLRTNLEVQKDHDEKET